MTIQSHVLLARTGRALATDHGACAKRVLIPSRKKRDFTDIPRDAPDKLQITFFSDPKMRRFERGG